MILFYELHLIALLLACLLMYAPLVAAEPGWEMLNASLSANFFGSCPYDVLPADGMAEREPADLLLTNRMYVHPLRPSQEEVLAYGALTGMLTRSNPKLGQGLVKGVPTADEWANRTGNSWQLAADHPRNNKRLCVQLSRLSGVQDTALEIYEKYKKNVDFYLIRARNALIHDSGVVALPCGYYQPTEGCETIFKFIGRKWWNKCRNSFRKTTAEKVWPEQWPNEKQMEVFNSSMCRDNSQQPFTTHKRVFVITASWDNNYHHFIIDSLSRLIRSIDFLKANPDVKIHTRRFEQYSNNITLVESAQKLRRRLIDLLGLDVDRFIAGPVLAEEVIVPRGVKCNYPIASAYEIRLLAAYMKEQAARRNAEPAGRQALDALLMPLRRAHKRLVLQQRGCDDLSPEKCNLVYWWRQWNSSVTAEFQTSFSRVFTDHEVTVMSSSNPAWTDCLSCQIQAYAETDVLVGLHGAGLTNMIFMRPGSLVVEIIGHFDGRMMPLCGYHGSLAAIFGVHHYLYYYDWRGGETPDPAVIAQEAFNYHRFLNK